MVTAIGGVILIVAVFVTWVAGRSAWTVFSAVNIIMLVVGAAAIVSALLPGFGGAAMLPARLALLISALGLSAFGFAAGWELEISGGIGVWLAIVGSLAIALGAYEAGGEPRAHQPSAPLAGPPERTPPTPPPERSAA